MAGTRIYSKQCESYMRVNSHWRATISKRGDQSFLDRSERQYPLDVVPYEGDNDELLVYLLSGSPGLFNGDRQEIECRLSEGAHLFLTDPSPTELRPSLNKEISMHTQTFYLEKDAILEYMPEPLIPFKSSDYDGKISIHMNSGSQAIIGDIVTAGRVGSGEIFQYHRYKSTFEVFMNGQLHVWDSIKLDPETNLKQKGILNDFTHSGALWMLSENITNQHLEEIHTIFRSIKSEICYAGATFLQQHGIGIRLLGNSSEHLQTVMQQCWDYFRVHVLEIQPMEVLK